MKKIIISAILMFCLLPSLVSAISYNTCIDNQTLQKTTNLIINNKNFDIYENVSCSFGCDSVNNECRIDAFWVDVGIIGGLIALFSILFWAYRRTR
jgi:hypothetical protein